MEVKPPMAGELTRRVEFFENVSGTDTYGTAGKSTPQSLGTFSAKRTLGANGVDEDGRLADVGKVTYQMRFNATLFAKAGSLFLTDFDGDWHVVGPIQILGGRNRYMQFNCEQRG